jgi:hypothetical protein
VGFRNIHACLVHESPPCVADLLANLRHLDPGSEVLLFDGSDGGDLTGGRPPGYDGVIQRAPPRSVPGRLHHWAFACMRRALAGGRFDTLTIVDSDQLALRAGYGAALAGYLGRRTGPGVLGVLANVAPPAAGRRRTRARATAAAWREGPQWEPFLRRFPRAAERFVCWTFWPAAVFSAQACQALVELWDADAVLREIVERSQIWPLEEIVLPTLVALLGMAIERTPFRCDFLLHRFDYRPEEADRALATPDAYWIHPVPRRPDDPLRRRIRDRHGAYRADGIR